MGINHIGKPKDTSLPFFAYGIFKPGQIAYPQIKKLVFDNPIQKTLGYEMLYRDGLPVLNGEKNEDFKTRGYLIKFKNPERAYYKIGKSKPTELYEWKVIDVDGTESNALVGKDIPNGCIENDFPVFSDYNYRNDSLFTDALDLIKECKEKYEDIDKIDMNDFFIIQMHYMLLWSVIERFCTLRYGYFLIGSNMLNFAREKVFKRKLKTITREDKVYTSDKLEEYCLNPNENEESIKYYYKIRCNVVHKGKTVKNDDRTKLKSAFSELYGLFNAVYKDDLNKNRQILLNLD